MAYSYITYVGNGTTTLYTFPFSYLNKSHVKVYVNDVLKTLTTDYTFNNDSTIQFNSAPASSTRIEIRRETSRGTKLVDYQDGSLLDAQTLDRSSDQLFYVMQEAIDEADKGIIQDYQGNYDADNKRIVNLATPINSTDAANKGYCDSLANQNLIDAQGYADQSQASASDAHTSQVNAADSKDNALNSAVVASGYASAAQDARDAARTARDAAQTAQGLAEAARDAAGLSATSATGSATTATNAASAASTSATNAAGSATAANASKVDAQTAEANAYATVNATAWDSGTTYTVNQCVIYGGQAYRCLVGNSNVTPGTDATKWRLLGFDASAYTTTTPTLSGTSSANEGTTASGSITNFSSIATYYWTIPSALQSTWSFTSSTGAWSFTLPQVSSDTQYTLQVYATVAGELRSATASKVITDLNIPVQAGATMSFNNDSTGFPDGSFS